MGKTYVAGSGRRLALLAVTALMVFAALAVTARPAGAVADYKHDGATSCGSCHLNVDNAVMTDVSCTACHSGGFASRSIDVGRTCWTCHDPGEDMSEVQGVGCGAAAGDNGCHVGATHLGSNLLTCTTCHGVVQSATNPGTSAHHNNIQHSAPTCGDCHEPAPHEAFVAGIACNTCHAGVQPTHPAKASMLSPTLTLVATPANIAPGGSTVLSGSLKSGVTPIAGVTVALQSRQAGTEQAFAAVAAATTSATGAFSFPAVSPSAKTTYRAISSGALVGGTTVRPGLKSLDVDVVTVVTPTLTIGLDKTSIKLGARITVAGGATPARPGVAVKLVIQKQNSSGAWKNLKTVNTALAATSTYGYGYKPGTKGSYRVQASTTAAAGFNAATTAWKTFKVK